MISGMPMDKYQDIEVISQRTVYSGFLELVVTELRYRLFSGAWGPVVQRDCVKRPVAVGVLLYDPKREEVVLVEQFRMGALEDPDSPWLFEIVAGLVEEGEDYADVARRETQEESNCVIKTLLPIMHYYTSPGSSTEYTHLYCGLVDSEGVAGIYGLPEEAEDIKLHVVSSQRAFDMIRTGEIKNVNAIVALQWLALNQSSF
jgi:ADP-ribose pyrophosphatase